MGACVRVRPDAVALVQWRLRSFVDFHSRWRKRSLEHVLVQFDHQQQTLLASRFFFSLVNNFFDSIGFFFFSFFFFVCAQIDRIEREISSSCRYSWCCVGGKKNKERLFVRRRHINRHFQLSAPHSHAHASAHAAPKRRIHQLVCAFVCCNVENLHDEPGP